MNKEICIKTIARVVVYKGKRTPSYIDTNGFVYNAKTLTIYGRMVDDAFKDLTDFKGKVKHN